MSFSCTLYIETGSCMRFVLMFVGCVRVLRELARGVHIFRGIRGIHTFRVIRGVR